MDDQRHGQNCRKQEPRASTNRKCGPAPLEYAENRPHYLIETAVDGSVDPHV